jgi:hypothetical protein
VPTAAAACPTVCLLQHDDFLRSIGPNRALGPEIDDIGHLAGPGCSALAAAGPLTGQVVDGRGEVFRRDQVMPPAIGAMERDDVGHQPATVAM